MKSYKQSDKDDQINEPAIAYTIADSNSVFSLINSIKRGIKFPTFKTIVDKSAFDIHEWSDFLHLSERTMQRYKKENKTFDPIYSEKILELSMLFNYGIEVFGNQENFNMWLQTTNIALGSIAPKEFLDNTFGIRLIKDELNRIEQGVLA